MKNLVGSRFRQTPSIGLVHKSELSVQKLFSDDFERENGPLGNGWFGDTFTISGGKAYTTPVLGSEMLTDGVMSITEGNLGSVFTHWLPSGNADLYPNASGDVRPGGSPEYSLSVFSTDATEVYGSNTPNATNVPGSVLKWSGWSRKDDTSAPAMGFYNANMNPSQYFIGETGWQYHEGYTIAGNTTVSLRPGVMAGAYVSASHDDYSLKPATSVITGRYRKQAVGQTVRCTLKRDPAYGDIGGGIGGGDSPTNPKH